MLQNNLVKEMTILKVVIISKAIKSALDRSYCRVKLLLILKCMKVFSRIHILNKYNTSFFSRILVTNAHEKQVSNPNATRIVMHQAHGL